MNKEKGVVEKCLLKISDPFTLVVLAAYRSQELASGITPCVATDGSKDALVSLKEISSGNLDMSSLEDRMVKSLQKFAFLSEDGINPAPGAPVSPKITPHSAHQSAVFGANALFNKPNVPLPKHQDEDAALDESDEDSQLLDASEIEHDSEYESEQRDPELEEDGADLLDDASDDSEELS